MEEEEVLVVEAGKLFAEKSFEGFLSAEEHDFLPTIRKNMFFKKRSLVENDFSLKQIIPYVVFASRGKVFLYQRTKSGSENRLHQKFSIGIGGHINPGDGPDFIENGMRREFLEELDYGGSFESRILGFINLDIDDVSKVHFGVVFLVTGDADEVMPKEKNKIDGCLVEFEKIAERQGLMEDWSKAVLPNLSSGMVSGIARDHE